MNHCFAALALLGALTLHTSAAGQPGATPHPVTLSFYIAGMECGACTDFINQSVFQVKGVKAVQPQELGCLNISFDTHLASAHQVAQAVSEALFLHGRPYEATLRFRVPDYARDDNATKVEAIFAARKEWVKVETVDKAKGEFAVHFLPLQVDQSKVGPQGWNPGHFGHAVHDPAPKGLGLAFALVKEGPPEPAPKADPARK